MRINQFSKAHQFISLMAIVLGGNILLVQAQETQITNIRGQVTESKTHNGLGGATIKLQGSTNTVVTNEKGEFNLTTYKKTPIVVYISYVGYETKEVTIPNTDPVSISLVESANVLSEVVVGYGTQRRKDITGSVASVPRENLARASTSFDNLLQGAVAGVVVSQSSGQPGATASIRIRGGNSLSYGNDPLYVIDGFIYYNNNDLINFSPGGSIPSVTGVSSNGLSTINPADIESVDILKDASATAIYGSRGANGVVIVTTKRGTKGSNNIAYNGSYGTQQAGKSISVLNGPQWAKLFDDLYTATPNIQAGLANNKKLIDSLGNAGVNGHWTDAALRTGIIQNHQLTIYGGDEKSRYSLSGNYFNQKGIVLGTDFTRYSARFNHERNFSKEFKISTNIFGSNSIENKLTGAAYNGIGFSNAFSSLAINNPLQRVTAADGAFNTAYIPAVTPTVNVINGQQFADNTIQDITSIVNQVKLSRILGNLAAEYKIADGLVVKSTFGADLLFTKLNYYAPSYTNPGNNGGVNTGVGSVTNINYLSWLNENTITYDRSFNEKHFVTVLAGYTTQYEKSEYTFAGGQNFSADATTYNNLSYSATAGSAENSGEGKATRNSWLGRISYSYLHKYNITVTGRADGASPAGVNKKWGFFPAVGVSWNASDEAFFKPLSQTINSLKLRLTAGSTGNANFPPYSSLSTIVPYGYNFGNPLTGTNGLAPSQLANLDLSWETTTQLNAGIDLGILENRISLVADAYYKKTSDLYISGSGLIPLATGYASASENIGSLENKGIEIALTTENIKTKNVSWKSSLLYSTNKSKILSLGPSKSFQPVAPTGQVSPVIVKVGLPVGTFWGYSTDGLLTTNDVYGAKAAPKLSGVSQVTGDRKYVDINGDGLVTTADKHSLGSAQPKFTASFSNTVTYKDFDLSFFFQGSFGNKIFNLLQQQLEKTTTTTNVSSVLLDRWDSTANPNGKIPKVVNAPVVQVADVYIEDGTYVRLKNITLGYNFPKNISSKILAKQLRIYVSAQNLLTFTKYKGLDPEANFYDQNNLQPGIDYGVYPNYKTYTIGVNVTF